MEKVNLIIFVRRPEISLGKTRLKKRIGKILGANFYYYNLYHHLLMDIIFVASSTSRKFINSVLFTFFS